MSRYRARARSTGVTVALIVVLGAVVFGLTALIAGCGGDGPPGEARAAPPPASVGMELAAQAADTFTVVATWSPVVVEGDTIREYVREAGFNDGSFETGSDTLAAVGSETLDLPAPPEGETVDGFYCLRSVRRAADGSPVVAPVDSTDFRACAGFQYTSPLSFPPPPDSLEVEPQQATAIDSVRILPDSIQFTFLTDAGADSTTVARQVFIEEWPVTEYRVRVDTGATAAEATVPLAALLLYEGEVVGCDGDCDQFPIAAAGWDDGVPYRLAGRPGYELGAEWRVERLPWFRELTFGNAAGG